MREWFHGVSPFKAQTRLIIQGSFFDMLFPQSPILTDYYANHSNHRQLVAGEPLLCSTILVIASRYYAPSGIAAVSRGSFIHDQLWNHAQGLIQSLNMGEGDSRLRSISSVEALLLLTEWHPRAAQLSAVGRLGEVESFGTSSSLLSTKRKNSVSHPSRQLDRMSWMLLGTAQMLAHELGAFQGRFAEHPLTDSYQIRCRRARDLLFIYTTLLAAKLGYASMTAITFGPAFLPHDSELSFDMLGAWICLIKVTRSVYSSMFSSPVVIRELLRTGGYIEVVGHFSQVLRQWESQHLKTGSAEKTLSDLLFFEFHYVCMYTKSPALQATVMRAWSEADGKGPSDGIAETSTDSHPSEHLLACEVIDHATQIVKRAVFLAREGKLRYHSARSFQRFISACVFMLKARPLGTRYFERNETSDADLLTELLTQGIQALKTSAPDDAHLASHYAILLEACLIRDHSRSDSPGTAANADAGSADVDPSASRTVGSRQCSDGFTDVCGTRLAGIVEPFDGFDLFAEFTAFDDLDFDIESHDVH